MSYDINVIIQTARFLVRHPLIAKLAVVAAKYLMDVIAVMALMTLIVSMVVIPLLAIMALMT